MHNMIGKFNGTLSHTTIVVYSIDDEGVGVAHKVASLKN